jgi:hypothetical protein
MVSALGHLCVSGDAAMAERQRGITWRKVLDSDPTGILTVAGSGLGSVVNTVSFLWRRLLLSVGW